MMEGALEDVVIKCMMALSEISVGAVIFVDFVLTEALF